LFASGTAELARTVRTSLTFARRSIETRTSPNSSFQGSTIRFHQASVPERSFARSSNSRRSPSPRAGLDLREWKILRRDVGDLSSTTHLLQLEGAAVRLVGSREACFRVPVRAEADTYPEASAVLIDAGK
jgi:hypothetical protein